MKKIFTLFALIFTGFLNSQVSLKCWALNSSQASTVTAIANGDTVTYFTTANALKDVAFKFKNTSAVTHTYSVRRTDLVLNTGATAYFGFGDLGTLFSPGTTTPPTSADYCTLLAGASTSISTNNNLYAELNEGPTMGNSFVRYKLFDVTSGEFGPDTLIFTIHYILDIPQSLQAWTVDATGTNTLVALTNGTVVSYVVAASSTISASTQEVFVSFKNTSSVRTNTYSVIRRDVILNSASPGALAHFCFGDLGSCYGAPVTEPSSDFSLLGPGATSAPGKQLITDLDEAYTAGYSEVNYKLFNLATGKVGAVADTLSFTFKYNALSGVKENKGIIENASDVYPNPTTNNANITIVLAQESSVKVQVYNSLGSLVYNGSEQQLVGKNKLNIDCTNFNSGLYFITVTADNSKVTKRLVISK